MRTSICKIQIYNLTLHLNYDGPYVSGGNSDAYRGDILRVLH